MSFLIPLTDEEIISNSRFEIDYGQVSLFDAMAFILNGESTFTIVSVKTGKRFTYRCKQSFRYNHEQKKELPEERWFVSVLTGPDNTSDYSYAGTIDRKDYTGKWVLRTTPKSRITEGADSFKSFQFVFELLQSSVTRIDSFRDKLLIYHDGKCSKCGRALTDPVSVAIAMGPICNSMAHKQFKDGCKKRGIKIDKANNKLIYPDNYKGKRLN